MDLNLNSSESNSDWIKEQSQRQPARLPHEQRVQLFRNLVDTASMEKTREAQLARERRIYKEEARRAAEEHFESLMRAERAKQRARGIAVARAAFDHAFETNPNLEYSLPYDKDLVYAATADDDGLPTNFNMNSLEYREWQESGREKLWRQEHDMRVSDVFARNYGFDDYRDMYEKLHKWQEESPDNYPEGDSGYGI